MSVSVYPPTRAGQGMNRRGAVSHPSWHRVLMAMFRSRELRLRARVSRNTSGATRSQASMP